MGAGSSFGYGAFSLNTLFATLAVGVLLVPFIAPFWITGVGLWPEIANLAHFLGFAAIALLVLAVTQRHLPPHKKKALGYWVTAALCLMLAIGTEAVQFFMKARNGSPLDILHNFTGAASALLVIAVWRKECYAPLRWVLLGLALALLAVQVYPVWLEYSRLQQKEARLPLLFGFDKPWEIKQIRYAHATPLASDNGQLPEGNTPFYQLPAKHWSTLSLERGWRHWGRFNALSITLQVANEVHNEPMKLYFYFKNRRWQKNKLRAEAHFSVNAGRQSITIPFQSILYEGAPLDMSQAEILFFELVKSASSNHLVLSLDELRLL